MEGDGMIFECGPVAPPRLSGMTKSVLDRSPRVAWAIKTNTQAVQVFFSLAALRSPLVYSVLCCWNLDRVGLRLQSQGDRIGHEDFELFSAMIRLQERTGGNLAELLRSNAKTIRDRQKMRLKVKAASAEGRMSALILNAAPILLFISVNKMSPEFYGDVKDNPIITYALWGVVIWMGVGNLVMRKMINFKI